MLQNTLSLSSFLRSQDRIKKLPRSSVVPSNYYGPPCSRAYTVCPCARAAAPHSLLTSVGPQRPPSNEYFSVIVELLLMRCFLFSLTLWHVTPLPLVNREDAAPCVISGIICVRWRFFAQQVWAECFADTPFVSAKAVEQQCRVE